MKKLAITLISITALASAFAFAQDHGQGDAHAQKIHEVMMKGLTDEEKQTAHNIHMILPCMQTILQTSPAPVNHNPLRGAKKPAQWS